MAGFGVRKSAATRCAVDFDIVDCASGRSGTPVRALLPAVLDLNGIAELRSLVGRELGTSGWHEIDQQRITAFARATDDFEAIHIDHEHAVRAGLGSTIAHGLYVLSLGPKFLYEIYSLREGPFGLNYGYERVRFVAPVPVGSRIRMRATLSRADDISGGTKFTIEETFEIAGQDKPACAATAVIAYFH